MEFNRSANWLQILGNFGLLGGLVLVALQIKQNSDLLELQLRKAEAENYISSELALVGEDFMETWQKHIESPEQLTLAEMRALDAVLYTHTLFRWWSSFQLYEEGLLEANVWQTAINVDIGLYYNTPYSRAWWSEIRKQLWVSDLPQELIDYIDASLEKIATKATHQGPADFYAKVKAALITVPANND